MSKTVQVVVGTASSGRVVREELLVETAGNGRLTLLCTPGLAQNLAAGDEISVRTDGSYEVHKRGGNLAVQVFTTQSNHVEIREWLEPRVADLDGRRDGESSRQLVYTVPARTGFPRVEAVFYELERAFAGAEWVFGNVYDPDDGVTPLNWW